MIIAQVAGVSSGSTTSAGVLIRQDLTAGAAEAGVLLNGTSGIKFVTRTTAGATLSTVAGAAYSIPYWVKLVRTGNIFYGYQSTDGINWTQVGSQTITMTGTIYLGLAATSGNNSSLDLAVLDGVNTSLSSIGIQFQGSGTALAATDSAGLLSVAQTSWNVLTGSSFSSQALSDGSGTSTTATLSGSATATYLGGASIAPPLGNAKLGSGELYDTSPSTFTLSNIPYATYDVYVYVAMDTAGRNETVSLTPSGGSAQYYSFATEGGGSAWTAATNTWNGTGTAPSLPSANYVHYTSVTSSSFTLTWGASGNGGINGIQIVPAGSSAPVINSPTTVSATTGAAFTYQITANHNPASYSATGLPSGLSVNTSTGVISGTPATTGTSTITLGATNAVGTSNATLTLTVNAPSSASIGIQFQAGHISLLSTDSAGLSSVAQTNWNVLTGFSFSSQALSNGSGASTSALISGVAGSTYSGGGSTASPAGNAKLGSGELNNTPTPFTVTNIPYTSYDVYLYSSMDASGRAEIVSLTPAGGSAQYYSYTTEGGGSAWAAATSTWNGTGGQPSLPSANYVHFTGLTAGSFTLAWGAYPNGAINGIQIVPTGSSAPMVTSPTTATGTVGSAFSYQITATNSPTGYTETGTLPAGLSFTASTGVISGTPTAAGGPTTVTIGASNAGGTGTASLAITINPPTPVITSATTATGTAGSAFSYQITATNSPTVYTEMGTLPAGLSFTASTGVAGSARANPTLRQIRDFIRSAPAPEAGGLEGIIFVDELCKLLPRGEDLAGSGWSLSCWAECIALLESDQRLLTHEWLPDDVRRFRQGWMILAGAAFQLALDEVRNASSKGDLGFGPSDGSKPTHVDQIWRYLPEELLSRFSEPIYLEPPNRRDFAAAFGRIHGELGVPRKLPIEGLIDEAVAAKGGMRFVENYLAKLIYEHPYAVRPGPKRDEPAPKKKDFDILGPDYHAQAKAASELSTRLRTLLGCIFAKLSSLSHCESDGRTKPIGGLLNDPQLGRCLIATIRACDLCQSIGPEFQESIEHLTSWRMTAWRGMAEQSVGLDKLGLTGNWIESWSLAETVLSYYCRFNQAARLGCLR